MEFVAVVNDQFQEALGPGSYITLDESMVKSFHRNLHGKIKIIRKSRPMGNEVKNLADAASQIVLSYTNVKSQCQPRNLLSLLGQQQQPLSD